MLTVVESLTRSTEWSLLQMMENWPWWSYMWYPWNWFIWLISNMTQSIPRMMGLNKHPLSMWLLWKEIPIATKNYEKCNNFFKNLIHECIIIWICEKWKKNTLRLVSLLKLDTPMGHVMPVFIDVESGGEELQHPKKFQILDLLYLVLGLLISAR